MKTTKNYFTVAELQQICQAFGVSTDGSKPEIVNRVANFVSTNTPTDISTTSDELTASISNTNDRSVEPRSFSDQHTQTSDNALPTPDAHGFQFNSTAKIIILVLLILVLLVGFVGGCISISQLFAVVEDIKIPVKHSWFG